MAVSCMNGARRELVAVGGVLWVKDGHCLGVGHSLGYASHALPCHQCLAQPSMLPTTLQQAGGTHHTGIGYFEHGMLPAIYQTENLYRERRKLLLTVVEVKTSVVRNI